MFRRDKGEDDDPFAALNAANERGSTTVTTGGTATAGAASTPSKPLGERPPKQRSNALLVLLTVLASLGGAGALVYFSDSPADSNAERGWFRYDDRPGDGGRSTPATEQPADDDAPPAEPKRHDLVQPAGFGAALARIEGRLRGGERVWLLRVARDRVNAMTRLRNGDQRSIDVDDELATRVTDSGSAGSHRGLALSRISALAPASAARNAARKAGISTRKLDYLVMTTPIIAGDTADWQIFFRDVPQDDSHFSASLDGRTVQRPGEGATTSTLRITTNGRTRTITGAQAQRISDCIRRAGTDGARIRRCLP